MAIRPRLVVNDLELALHAGLSGMGIIPAPMTLAAPHVAKKQLIQLLRDWTRPAIDVHAVFPPGGALVPKTRAFLDLLSDGFQRPPSLQTWYAPEPHDFRAQPNGKRCLKAK